MSKKEEAIAFVKYAFKRLHLDEMTIEGVHYMLFKYNNQIFSLDEKEQVSANLIPIIDDFIGRVGPAFVKPALLEMRRSKKNGVLVNFEFMPI